jgi:cell division protein FtsB
MENRYYRREKRSGGLRKIIGSIVQNKKMMILLSIGGPLLLFVLFNNRGVLQRMKLENQKNELEVRVQELRREQSELEQFSRLLDGDRATIEKVARERYGMVRDGETLYRVHRTK